MVEEKLTVRKGVAAMDQTDRKTGQKGDQPAFKKGMKDRIIRLKLVDGTLVNGQVNINRDHGYDRLSDLVTNSREPFLILYNVTVFQADFEKPVRHQTLFINKAHILWAEPEQAQK